MTEDVTVVVVTYNSAHVIGGLLDSLPAALDGLVGRVIVVDNSSTDRTVAVVSQRDDCELVRAPNLGYAAGINRGVAAAPGGAPVLVLNPDVLLRPGAARRMMEALKRPRVGIVAPRVLDEGGRLHPSMRREPTLPRALGLSWTHRPFFTEYVDDAAPYEKPQVCDWALGAVMLVSRECHESLGGWDESFFLYAEETDLCLRARDAGWLTWYEPSAVAVHIGGQSGQSARIHAMQILNRVRLYGRRHGKLATLAFHLAHVLSELSWALRGQHYSWYAIRTLLVPTSRPAELGLASGFLVR